MTVEKFSCGTLGCSAAWTGERRDLLVAGWHIHRGAAARYASCPDHRPEWVEGWLENQAEQAKRSREYEAVRLRTERTREILEGETFWQLKMRWPSAWDNDWSFFGLANEKADEVGAGTTGGARMTGAPLYNSPSDLNVVFSNEKAALTFFEWARGELESRWHDDCDTRFYTFELEQRKRYALNYRKAEQ